MRGIDHEPPLIPNSISEKIPDSTLEEATNDHPLKPVPLEALLSISRDSSEGGHKDEGFVPEISP